MSEIKEKTLEDKFNDLVEYAWMYKDLDDSKFTSEERNTIEEIQLILREL